MARTIHEALAPYWVSGSEKSEPPMSCTWDGCNAVGNTLCYGEWLCRDHQVKTIAIVENANRQDTEG